MSAPQRASAAESGKGAGRVRHNRNPPRALGLPEVTVRCLRPGDYSLIRQLLHKWLRGRNFDVVLPRSFFRHFANTSLVMCDDNEIVGVLVGFRSQTEASTFIHFVAIEPASRRRGLGRVLYEHFFALSARLGCTEVHAVTAPINSALIAFHRQLDFEVIDGGGFSCGIAVSPDFAGPGQHRVLFRRRLQPSGDAPSHRPFTTVAPGVESGRL